MSEPSVVSSRPLLRVEDLTVSPVDRPGVRLVDGVSFTVDPGEALGLVGESGSGKSLTLRAVLGLPPAGTAVTAGRVHLDGTELLGLPPRELRAVRGRRVGMVFQDPMTALNPVMTVGDQIVEGPLAHRRLARRDAARHAVELLDRVGIPDAARRVRAYPHEFSGGMRQRVMIAVALACSPRLLLCDEPTTALDVTTQEQILRLLDTLREDTGVAVVFVTHDLAVVARLCERVAVMYAGQVVESGDIDAVFRRPRHAYTLGLLRSAPDLHTVRDRLGSIPGLPPDPGAVPPGCRFAPRCAFGADDCREDRRYPLLDVRPGHRSTCVHRADVTASVDREPVIADG